MSSLAKEAVFFVTMLLGFTIFCLTLTGLLVLIGLGLLRLGGTGLLVAAGIIISCLFIYFFIKEF